MKAKRFQISGRWLVLAALTASLLVLLSACGGGTPPAAPSQSPAPSPQPVTTTPPQQQLVSTPSAAPSMPSGATSGGDIEVILKDNTFPKEIRVKSGAKVTFVVSNRGSVEHTFEIPDFGLKETIPSSGSARIAWTVPDKKGEWDAGCYLTDDESHDGMEGTLIIQ